MHALFLSVLQLPTSNILMCELCNAATTKRFYGEALSKLSAVFYELAVARVRVQKHLSYFPCSNITP